MWARTPAWAEATDTAASTAGVRMAAVTSRPSRATVWLPSDARPKSMADAAASASSAAASSMATPRSSAARATQRYMAPVSR